MMKKAWLKPEFQVHGNIEDITKACHYNKVGDGTDDLGCCCESGVVLSGDAKLLYCS